MTSKIIYEGNLRTRATHIQSNSEIITDAPTDNHGKGEKFSPTDLVATALGSCMMTLMGISAEPRNIKLEGTSCEITKIMQANPRRIGEIIVKIMVKGQESYSEKEIEILEKAALTCPVYQSLHSELKKTVEFIWP